jgi:hypothetical protein
MAKCSTQSDRIMPKLLLLVVYLIVGTGFLVTDDGGPPTVM